MTNVWINEVVRLIVSKIVHAQLFNSQTISSKASENYDSLWSGKLQYYKKLLKIYQLRK